MNLYDLCKKFPVGIILFVSIFVNIPDWTDSEKTAKDEDVIRITRKGFKKRIQLLACRRGNWVAGKEKMSPEKFAKNTYEETGIDGGKKYPGACCSVRYFYHEDKALLKDWKFVTPELQAANGICLPSRKK
jgi:hypothetical protein